MGGWGGERTGELEIGMDRGLGSTWMKLLV